MRRGELKVGQIVEITLQDGRKFKASVEEIGEEAVTFGNPDSRRRGRWWLPISMTDRFRLLKGVPGKPRPKRSVAPGVPPTDSEVSKVMRELGRRGGKVGGKKRMESLSAERRSEIASKAARARWDASQ